MCEERALKIILFLFSSFRCCFCSVIVTKSVIALNEVWQIACAYQRFLTRKKIALDNKQNVLLLSIDGNHAEVDRPCPSMFVLDE